MFNMLSIQKNEYHYYWIGPWSSEHRKTKLGPSKNRRYEVLAALAKNSSIFSKSLTIQENNSRHQENKMTEHLHEYPTSMQQETTLRKRNWVLVSAPVGHVQPMLQQTVQLPADRRLAVLSSATHLNDTVRT